MTDLTTTVACAIRQSVTEDRTVEIDVTDLTEAYAEISSQTDECDSATEQDGSLDVWGTTEDGDHYRLSLRAVPESDPPATPTEYRAAYLAYARSVGVVLTGYEQRELSDADLRREALEEMAREGIPATDVEYLTIGLWRDA